MGQERLGPSYFFIPLVIGPLNSLVWYVPSLRYTNCLDWHIHCGAEVTESSTNKQHHLSDDDDAFYLSLQKQKIALKPYTPPLGYFHIITLVTLHVHSGGPGEEGK